MQSQPLVVLSTSDVSRASRRRQLAIGLLISAITLAFCLGGIELVGYIWENRTAQGPLGWTLVGSRRMPMDRHGTMDQPYYLLQPNHDYLWEGIPVHINSRGFRTEEFLVPKPANTYRILNLGDSVAFGWEVQQKDTYGKLLELALNGHQDDRKYEVINAGTPAWNLESERNFLLQEGLQYQPDLVILDVTVVNDIYGGGPAVSQKLSIFQWLRDHTHAWPFLTTQARFLLAKQKGPEAIPVLNPPRNADAYYPLDEESPVYDQIWGYIAEMYAACRQRDIDFLVVVFPTAFQLNSAKHPDVPQRVFGERARKAEMNYTDLLPVYRQVCQNAAPGACEGYENLLFADVWMHPNPLGHQLAAREIEVVMNKLVHRSGSDNMTP
jgi:lysophospholipase L1-like esterase